MNDNFSVLYLQLVQWLVVQGVGVVVYSLCRFIMYAKVVSSHYKFIMETPHLCHLSL